MNKLVGFVKLMRPINCVMMGFAVLVGAMLATAALGDLKWLNLLSGFLTGFTFCAAAMVINDYYDRSIDAINEPARPIPSGTIKTNEALAFMAVLTTLGFVFALWVSIGCLVVAAISLVITGTYLTVGKRSGLPGNFLVSACVAIPFIYGSFVAVGTVGLNVVLFASTKGIVDIKGDSAEGIKTLAVRFGEKKAAVSAVVFYVSAVALTPITWFLGLVGIWFIPFVLVTDVGLLTCSGLLLKNPSRENSRRIKNVVLILFIFGLIAYIFGSFK
jgi:geranylgeranylglycerol-phosphate geranylgeranyltransferase